MGDEPGMPGPETTVVPLFSVPDSLRSVDVAVGGRAVRGLLLITAVLLLTLGGRWWWVSQQAVGVPVEQVVGAGAGLAGAGPGSTPPGSSAEGTPAEGGGGPEGAVGAEGPTAPAGPSDAASDTAADEGEVPGAAGASTAGGADAAGEAVLVVHVIGEVQEPGVVELPSGSRVIDAVRAAGGVTDEADPASLNLARSVVDGEQVWVGAPGEEPPPWLQAAPAPPAVGVGGGAGGPGSGQPGDGVGGGGGQGALLVDLNRADQAQLEELPGVGPVTAGNILAWREQHGGFTAVEELTEVSGIGEKTLEQLRPHVSVGG
ncbi:helix-hairpin-helix domain-containing protein [Ornithinimicrobium pratense]|uniref:ComEA family DNA-binding protein n=1 Tax=Ornithinimicrobium pratense TaxID=2593973 RepID=A0A5J6V442_9MICO|nr:helix-hairpin-helix domain-containing protein [Ornithinimicrobium pratense]QFG68054.1 ComEA family DNA-binding protein [Ornithinimicrobium pratense]